MSSPISSLRKPRKTALPGVHHTAGQRATPFRNKTDLFDDSNSLLDDIILNPSVSRQSVSRHSGALTIRSEPLGNVKMSNRSLPKLNKDSPSAPSDFDLMSSMMSRISQLELRVQYYAKEVIDKDRKINVLEEKAKLLQKYKGEASTEETGERIQDLERKCQTLQETIKDMEDFLADYGMIWVGDDEIDIQDKTYRTLSRPAGVATAGIWRPGESVAPSVVPFHVDFDQVTANIKELNIISGDGEKRIHHTAGGARFVSPEPVAITLYANGIFMFEGPFRSYEEPTTQRCVQDFMDGYFPNELQARFPDGVPFQVTDKRDTVYADARTIEQFPGSGNLLGGDTKPSRLVPSQLDKGTDAEKSYTTSHDGKAMYKTSHPPKPRISTDQFLNRLPLSVVKDGKVIDVRESLAGNLKHDAGKPGVTIVNTPAVQEILDRANSHTTTSMSAPQRPLSTRGHTTTLRIKSENGEHTFIVKMLFTDTIKDVRRYLDSNRSTTESGLHDYDIATTFPAKVYVDQTATLQECGLTPNAALHLKLRPRPRHRLSLEESAGEQ